MIALAWFPLHIFISFLLSLQQRYNIGMAATVKVCLVTWSCGQYYEDVVQGVSTKGKQNTETKLKKKKKRKRKVRDGVNVRLKGI